MKSRSENKEDRQPEELKRASREGMEKSSKKEENEEGSERMNVYIYNNPGAHHAVGTGHHLERGSPY